MIVTQQIKNEFSVLLSMMIEEDNASYGIAELTDEYFTDLDAKRIFNSINSLYYQKRTPSLQNIEFPKDKYNIAMQEGVLEGMAFMATVNELINWKACRELLDVATIMQGIATGGNFAKAHKYATEELSKIFNNVDKSKPTTWAEAAKLAEERIMELRNPNKAAAHFIKSGYKRIDECYRGFPAELVIVAADSGEGKSTVVLPTILANLDSDIFIASTEVSAEGLSANISAIEANIFRGNIHKGDLSDADFDKYIATLRNKIAKMKGEIETNNVLSTIISRMKAWRANTDKSKIGLVVVDFLNDIFDDYGNTYADDKLIRNAISKLKRLGKQLNVCMIVLCQFNTKRSLSKDKRPIADFIYGSRSVYQSAFIVIYPYRPAMFFDSETQMLMQDDRYEDAFLVIGKYKEQAKMDIPVVFDKYVTQFLDIQQVEERVGNSVRLADIKAPFLNRQWKLELEKRKKQA